MTLNDNQEDKRFSSLLSALEQGKTATDERFLHQLREKSLAEYLSWSAERRHGKTTNVFLWRKVMTSNATRFAAAATIIIALTIVAYFSHKSVPAASAAEVLAEAARAVSNLRSVYIKARMRTLPCDKFELIGLNYDFVPVEMWKKLDDSGLVKWRTEKPLRVAAMNGKTATILIGQTYASQGRCPDFECYDCRWCGQLMNVDSFVESELREVQQRKDAKLFMHHEIKDGKETLVLEINVRAAGDYISNDYIRNKFISESGHTRIYYFDAETKFLEGFEIYVQTDDGNVLVFEITNIEYNLTIDDSLFGLDLPEDVIWLQEPEIQPDNEKYEKMTP